MAYGHSPDVSWLDIERRCRQVCSRFFRGKPEAIEDAISTALVRLWDKRGVVTVAAKDIPAYVTRVAENVCVSQVRGSRRWETLTPLDEATFVPASQTVHDIVERRLLLRWAMRQVDALPARLREPFVAHVLHGESFDLVARELGITESAARKRVADARRVLAAAIQSDDGATNDQPAGSQGTHGTSGSSDADSDPREPGDQGSDGAIGPLLEEIAARMVDTCVIQVPLKTGGTLEYHAVFEHGLGRRRQRIGTLEQHIADYPRGWRRRLELANLLLAENRTEEAEAQYREVLTRQPRVLIASMRLAQLVLLSGRAEEAVAVLEAALAYVLRPATRHHLCGLIERAKSGSAFPQYSAGQRNEHFARAVEEFRAAAAEEPRNLSHLHELALTYESWGRPVEASAAYDAALEVDPDDVYALARSHNALTAQDKHDAVLPRLERAVALDPNYTYAAKLLGDRYATLGMVRGDAGKRTRALLRRTLARNPDSADAMDAMTRYYESRGDTQTPVSLWREFLTRNPGNAKGWAFLGTALERAGDLQGSADAYTSSHSLDPSWLDVYWRGIPVLIAAQRNELAHQWTEDMLRRFPDHWDALVRGGTYLWNLGETPDRCVRIARRCVELQPDVEAVWRNCSRLLLEMGLAAEALDAAIRCEEIARQIGILSMPWCLVSKGRALRALGREKEAQAAFREYERMARARRPFDRHYLKHVGEAREELGDLEGALKYYRRGARNGDWQCRLRLAQIEGRSPKPP